MNDTQPTDAPKPPTVLLVHGAFAESASWNGVIANLHRRGRRGARFHFAFCDVFVFSGELVRARESYLVPLASGR